ncbi:chaperonin 10-like protein [Piptocephalis cylindrospora]|uniref:Chaperonin 10-like protein n=1 Tax=Piptocephalis cylindrospora TaxID=1907219 RepID=A0A4P9XZQ8_9FUNG|nr:chaperonin 10-like protein [Piptocephalis cylindrospora]|eukprot:RKP11963.1 chaperonin 10-like protein [Piptocephalis cylindrospora]
MPANTIPEKFTGWAAMAKDKDLVQWSYTPKPFEEGDIDIRITHCGICGTDVHTLECGWDNTTYPIVAGHEIVGEIVRVGKNVKGLKVGQRVGVGCQSDSCGKCPECKSNKENYCREASVMTYNGVFSDGARSQGGYADYIRVPFHFAIPVPDAIDSASAAPLFCAGVTTYMPLKEAGVKKGMSVGVVGVGGLGHLGIQWAKAMGADHVTAISIDEAAKPDASELGADRYLLVNDPEQIKKANRSIDVLLVTVVSRSTNFADLVSLMNTGGKILLVGLPNGTYDGFPPWAMCERNISIITSLIGSPSNIQEMLKLAAKKKVRVWVEKRPMSDVNAALEDMRAAKAHFRYVLEN